MKPTRAPEIRSSTPSSIPSPARRIGHTATFLPEMRGIGATSSGVSTSTSSVGKSFVASYVSRYVTSSTSLRKCTVGVSLSRRYESLCWTSGWRTSVTDMACATLTTDENYRRPRRHDVALVDRVLPLDQHARERAARRDPCGPLRALQRRHGDDRRVDGRRALGRGREPARARRALRRGRGRRGLHPR